MLRLFLLLLAARHIVKAACPNFCSGHGACGPDNKCTCDSDWAVAPDCSQRKCPSGVAWSDKASATNTAHALAECSNRGICDSSKGVCNCFTGFTVRCPNDCSGHGLCYSLARLALEYGPDTLPGVGGDGVGPVYSNWEKDSMSSCFCDMGYGGADCSIQLCPKNDDPLTTGQGFRTIKITIAEATAAAFLGNALHVKTTKAANTDFNMIYAEANSVMVFKVDGSGKVTAANGITITTSGLLVSAGGITVTQGGATITAGGLVVAAAGATITTAGALATDTAVTAEATAAAFLGNALHVKTTKAANTDFNMIYAEANSVMVFKTTKAANTDFNMIYAEANSVMVFKVDGSGKVTAANGITVTTGGLVVTAGGLTVTAGGITIAGGGLRVEDTGLTVVAGVMQLRPVTYEWRQDVCPQRNFPNGTFAGFIADEVEELLPHLILVDGDGWKSLDYPKLTPYIIRSIQELRAEVNETTKEGRTQITELSQELMTHKIRERNLEASLVAHAQEIDELKAQVEALRRAIDQLSAMLVHQE
ncbi:hypothetical protein P43SY_005786 [Pythium insidiosum]|uniref:Peptidase S74 domain-containing protein n=1 Tax=Pythium insidiosum TaxID=114742 RepID=A0AAD5LQQ3_PYTIN|nr:hypothetical protein P43SY_005786 [Pythium insidiosum]